MIISEDHYSILDLPNEVQLQIFDYLDLNTRKTTSRVCRLWNILSFTGRCMGRICLHLNVEGSQLEQVVTILNASSRRYRHVVINFNNRFVTSITGLRVSDVLESLVMIGMSKVTDSQLIELLEDNPNLKRLFLLGDRIDKYRKTRLFELPTMRMVVRNVERFPCWLEALSVDSTLMIHRLNNLCVLVPSFCTSARSINQSINRIFPDVRILQLTGTDLSVATVISFPKLDYLHIDRLEISDQQTETSCVNLFRNELHCARLQTLILHPMFMIRTAIFTTICHYCLALKRLKLSLDYLDGDALKQVTRLRNLQNLTLHGTAYFHDTSRWSYQITTLTTVSIVKNRSLIPLLQFIADIAPNLLHLSLEDVEKPEEMFRILPTLAGNLTHLEMSYSRNADRPPSCHPSGLLRSMENLETVEIRRVTINHGIQGWIQDAPRLRNITIIDCATLNDTHLIILTTICPKLKQLRLSNCPGITANGITEFQCRIPCCTVTNDM
ncbi:uncharacterized protein LOC131436682 isoform X2 [Malaya genurostris]|uniref:uncharacterized protein LOC131436682 isoform X2 n=1 Tax=Malaya genurostris TaxID=325434 RepID=UPI0026F3E97D|nr:uncharacterized protein LOC131436682 isoform X2 [Malaya genurostris]